MPYKDPAIAKQKKAEAYLKNREKVREQQKQYREKNKEKTQERNQKWVQENKERYLARLKKWREGNPEKAKDSKRQSYLKNREHYLEKAKEYAAADPQKGRDTRRKYKKTPKGQVVCKAYRNSRRKREEDASLGRRWQNEVYEIYKQCAQLRQLGHDVEVDHIVPLLGKDICGLHTPWNLAIIPAKDNRIKTNKFVS